MNDEKTFDYLLSIQRRYLPESSQVEISLGIVSRRRLFSCSHSTCDQIIVKVPNSRYNYHSGPRLFDLKRNEELLNNIVDTNVENMYDELTGRQVASQKAEYSEIWDTEETSVETH